MNVGDRVFLAYASSGTKLDAHVFGGIIIAKDERDTIVRCDGGGLITVSYVSAWKMLPTEAEAWAHCAADFRVRAAEVLAAAEKCDVAAQKEAA